MTKALSNMLSESRQRSGGRRGPALGAALAAALLLGLAAGEAAASARPSERTPPAAAGPGAAVQPAGWEYQGQHLRLHRVVPPERHHGAQHHGAQRHKFHQRQVIHGQGHGHGHKKLHHKGRRHYGQACRPVRVVGWHRGHRALFGQVLCVNRFGQHGILRGSRHLIRYLHH